MAQKSLPSQDDLRQLLCYMPQTGKLYWRPRCIEWFTDCGRLTAQNKQNAWNGRNAGKEAFTASDGKGYLQGQVLKYHTSAHRVIWAWMHGEWPNCLDHIDGNGENNRADNLRKVTRRQNSQNSALPSNNTSGFMGVRLNKRSGKWEAQIGSGLSYKYLGTYSCVTSAAIARRKAVIDMGYHPNHGTR